MNSSRPHNDHAVPRTMQIPDGTTNIAYGPAAYALRMQSMLALAALGIALSLGIGEFTGFTPDMLFATGGGSHPFSLLCIALFSVALYRPGLFKSQSLWRRAVFLLVFGLSLLSLIEFFEFSAPVFSGWILNMLHIQYLTVDRLASDVNTATALLFFSLGALVRSRGSTTAFLISTMGLIPISYALFSYLFDSTDGYGTTSPVILLMLAFVGASEICVFSRSPLLRPLLSESPWSKMARRQLVAGTVGLGLLGILFQYTLKVGIPGGLLASIYWMFVIVHLAAGPMFERVERERRHLARQMETQARRDPLTGLWNRHAVWEFVADCQGKGGFVKDGCDQVGIILADVDYFKRVNDTSGHAVGDAVLNDVATQLRRKLRPSDILARWGGEEFLILLPGADLSRTMSMAQVLRAGVASHVGWNNGQSREAITLSLGVALFENKGDEMLEPAIQRADSALYIAKSQGRNRVLCSEEETPVKPPAKVERAKAKRLKTRAKKDRAETAAAQKRPAVH